MAVALLRALAGAASGPSLYKRASFLLDKLGAQIAAAGVTVHDHGTISAKLFSKIAARISIEFSQGPTAVMWRVHSNR